jgi:hypothetical protein
VCHRNEGISSSFPYHIHNFLIFFKKCGATKQQFDQTLGIHPTIAEEFTTLKITKRSGLDEKKGGC